MLKNNFMDLFNYLPRIRIHQEKGTVRSFGSTLSKDSIVRLDKSTRSFSLSNQGLSNVIAGEGNNAVLIKPNGTEIFGGYDDSFRADQIPIRFEGLGTNLLKIIIDRQVTEACWKISIR